MTEIKTATTGSNTCKGHLTSGDIEYNGDVQKILWNKGTEKKTFIFKAEQFD